MKLIYPTLALAATVILTAVGGVFQPSGASAESIVPEPTPAPASRRPIADITIAAVGDIMLGSTSIDETFLPPNDGADMLRDFVPVLSKADIAFGNLEGPLVDGGKNEKCGPRSTRCFAFRTPPRYGRYLKEAGFDILSMANNHAGDFGDFGRISTRSTLDELGIKHAGSERGAFATSIVESRGRRIAFVAFAHNNIVPNLNDLAAARLLVEDAARRADLVVVSFHGGTEGENAERVPFGTEVFLGQQRGNLRQFARTVIDAGADLVLGHGPHVLRGLELYKDRLVVYSMGNFATYGMFNLKGPKGLTAVFEIRLAPDGTFAGGRIHPGTQPGRGGPVTDPTGEAIRKVRELTELDFPTSGPKIGEDGTIAR